MSELEAIFETSAAAAVEIAASAMAERGESVRACANCTKPMIGAYCAVCGQERDTHRRSLWGLARDLIEDIVSFDSRILRTVTALLIEPGEIAVAFREGRTRRFVPPLRLYFFVSLLFFLMLSVTGLAILQLEVIAKPTTVTYDANGNATIPNPAYDPDDDEMKHVKPTMQVHGKKNTTDNNYNFNTQAHFFSRIGAFHSTLTKAELDKLQKPDAVNVQLGDDSDLTPAQKKVAEQKKEKVKGWIKDNVFAGIHRIANDPAALNGPLTTWIPRALFLLMPLYAMLLALFYIRQRKNFYFVDHLIFSLTIFTFTFVVLMVDAALAQFLSGAMVALLTVVAISIYIFIAMKRFYRQGWFMTTLKFFFVSFIYTCFFLLPAIGIVVGLSFFGDNLGGLF